MKDSSPKKTAHVVSHTHWDREWRYPIWETRLMLVDFMDELVEVLESGKYPGFLLDGQVAPVLDYLEIRPEMTDRIRTLVSSGKLEIGPWLVLPDEYPVDGEAMIRNLLCGFRQAEALGGVFSEGYTPFGWGQTAQLPQIYAGFGMEVALVGKKVNKDRAPKCEFIWRAPDGSELLATRFGTWGRQNFYFYIHLPALFGVDHLSRQWKYEWQNGGIAYHRADREQMEQDHFRLDSPDHWHPEYITPEVIESAWQTTDESVLNDDRLMMNGCDYAASQKLVPEMLARLNEVDTCPDREWVHTTMTQFVELMKQKIDRSQLVVVDGELRDGPVTSNTGNALTTRLQLKQLNKRAQNLLIRFTEPLASTAAMLGAAYPERFLEQAWDYLLKSHPHDSINGVTQDKTAMDVSNRLAQVVDLSESLGNRAMQELVQRIDMSNFADEDVLIVVFNSLPYSRNEVIESWVNTPPRPDGFNFLLPGAEGLQVFDGEGNAVGTQWMGVRDELYPVAELHTRAFPYECQQHQIFFQTGEIPAGGYKIFRVASIEEGGIEGVSWTDELTQTGNLLQSPHVLENEYLRVEIKPNGTFDLTDKRLSHTFEGLNYYQDRGEHGNYWINKRPMQDEVHTSLGCAARIWSEQTGPLQATLVSEVTMSLPTRGIPEQQRRGDEKADFTLRTAITLRAGAEEVEVHVEFDNRHEDHYLRVMFPTGLSAATHADAGGHFTVDRRPIKPQGPTPDSAWPDMATLPQNNFVDVSDGKIGLAFINDSLSEYEVLDNAERTMALSLLRSVKNWICTERAGSDFPSQKGGKALGPHSFRYSLRPHAGNWEQANIPLAAELFNVPVRPIQTRAHQGSLPTNQASLFSVSNPELRFSALKKAEDCDTFIVRLYNPTSQTQEGTLRLPTPAVDAWLTNLNEIRISPIELGNKTAIPISADSQKIITIEIKV